MTIKTIGVAIDTSGAKEGQESFRKSTDEMRADAKRMAADVKQAEKSFDDLAKAAKGDGWSDNLKAIARHAKEAADSVHALTDEMKKLRAEAMAVGRQRINLQLADQREKVAGLIEHVRAVAVAANDAERAMVRFGQATRQAVIEGGKLRVAQAQPRQLSGSSPSQLRIAGPIIDAQVIPQTTSAFQRLREVASSTLQQIAAYARGAQAGLSSLASSAGQLTSSAFSSMGTMARGAMSAIGSAASSLASGGMAVLRFAALNAARAIVIGGVATLGPLAAIGYGAHRAAQAFGGWGAVFRSATGALGSLTNGVMRAITSVSTLSLGVVGLGGLSLGFLLKSAIETADAFALMERKLMGLAGGSFATFSRLSGAINDIAVATRSGIADSADQFNRMHLTLSNLGNSVETTAALTKGLSAELKLSGASAEESKRAMIQLSQWIGKGKADLSDLKSIREQAPGLMAQIEIAAGRSMAKIAEVFKEGGAKSQALTSQIFTYLANGADQAVEKLKGMPRTFEEAVIGVKNAWFNAVGAMQQRSNFMGPLNDAADRLAQVIGSEAFIRGFSEALRYGTDMLATLVEWVSQGGNIERSFLTIQGYVQNIGSLAKAAALDFKDWTLPWWLGGGDPAAKRVETLATSISKAADEQLRFNEALRAAEAFYGSENTGVGGVKANAVGANGNRPASTAPRGNYRVNTPMPAASKSSGGGGAGGDPTKLMWERLMAMTKENELLDAQIAGNADLIRKKELELEIERAITSEQRAKQPVLAQLIEQEIKLKHEKQEQLKWAQIGRDLAAEGVQKLWDGMMKVGEGTLKMRDFMKQFLAEMIKATAQAYILKPILDSIKGGSGGGLGGIGGGIGSFITSLFSASGNAFGPAGHMTAFANGGAFTNSIVSSPTAFSYGGGKLGVMGEAGEEAVMPLTRIGGKLGVLATGTSGAGSNVTNNININVAGDANEQTIERMRGMVQQEIAAATPGIVKNSVAANRRAHVDNPNHWKR